MSIYSSKRKSRRASRSQLGHLKLSVYEDSSALIVHVYEARGLQRRETSPLDTYVKLYLLPDPSKLTKEKTRIVKQKDPVFNEKFSFILTGNEDIDKKLLISVWSHHTASRNEMIGCMTFKVAEILGPDKSLNGWYQLLDEVKGQESYHQVPLTISRSEGTRGDPCKRTFAVTLVRSERGYGFSVDGHSPVFISQVLKGYPAALADIKVGDTLIEAEGTDVTKASANLVVTIFKKCPQVIHLILQRGQYISASLRRPPKKKTSLTTPYSQSQLSLRPRPSRTSLSGLSPEHHQHHSTSRRASTPLYESSLTQPDSVIAENGDHTINRWSLSRSREQLFASQGQLRSAESVGHFTRQSIASIQESEGTPPHTLTQPSNEPHTLTQPTPPHTLTQPSNEPHTLTQPTPPHPLTQPSNEPHTLTQPTPPHTLTQFESLAKPNDLGALVKTASPRSKLVGVVRGNLDSAYSSGIESTDAQPVDWESLGQMGQQRQRAVNNLLTTQLTLTEELKMGVETYIEPLTSILPPDVHQRMFMGLHQLCAVSVSITSQLKPRRLPYTSPEAAPFNTYIESLADIYWFNFSELLDCLTVILGNSGVARQEIATSFAMFEAFSRLVEDSVVKEHKHSIYSFVEAVNEYVPKLARSMFALVYFTPLTHEDQRHLASITQDLMKLCRDKDLISRWERQTESMRRLGLCVAFGSKVKQVRLNTPGRLLIQEGEMVLVERRRKRKVWVLLLSDLLLVTKKHGRILTVTEDPLPLEQVMVQDFHCSDSNEIQVSTTNGSWSRLFRAASEGEKEVWMAKIKERASGSLSNRRKQGDKSRSYLQPHIADALRKQSHQIQASAVTMETTDKGEDSLTRGSSKRRSLFSMGSKRDKISPSERNTKLKRSFRGKPAAPKKLTLTDVAVETLKKWKISFDTMIHSQDGLVLFEDFLKSEFSEENIQFWKACQRFKTVPMETLSDEAKAIHDEYILQRAPKWVNLDHPTTTEIADRLASPDQSMFLKAQHQIYILMQRDSFKRFIDSQHFQSALKR